MTPSLANGNMLLFGVSYSIIFLQEMLYEAHIMLQSTVNVIMVILQSYFLKVELYRAMQRLYNVL